MVYVVACYDGHVEIVEMMIQKGANDWNRGLHSACQGGHIEVVKMMIQKGAGNWYRRLYGAYLDICKKITE